MLTQFSNDMCAVLSARASDIVTLVASRAPGVYVQLENPITTMAVSAMLYGQPYIPVGQSGYFDFGVAAPGGTPWAWVADARLIDPATRKLAMVEAACLVEGSITTQTASKVARDLAKVRTLPPGVKKLVVLYCFRHTELFNGGYWTRQFGRIHWGVSNLIVDQTFALPPCPAYPTSPFVGGGELRIISREIT